MSIGALRHPGAPPLCSREPRRPGRWRTRSPVYLTPAVDFNLAHSTYSSKANAIRLRRNRGDTTVRYMMFITPASWLERDTLHRVHGFALLNIKGASILDKPSHPCIFPTGSQGR